MPKKKGEDTLNAPKKRKIRKPSDGAWTKRSNPSKQVNHGLITQLNGTLMSPAKNIKVVTEQGITFTGALSLEALENADFDLSTPFKGVQSSRLIHDEFFLLRSRTIKSHQGQISVYLSEEKVKHQDQREVPPVPQNLDGILNSLGFPCSKANLIQDIEITKQSLNKIKRLKTQNNGARKPDNSTVVNKVSANDLAQAIGLDVSNQPWQFLHMIAHSLWGDEAQNLNNFVLGTFHENGVMNDLAESLVDKILGLPDAPSKLYLSAQAEWVPGFEAARLAQKVVWTLRDGPEHDYQRFVEFEFNPLSTRKLVKNEMTVIRDLLCHLFTQDQQVQLISPNKQTLALQSPISPLVKSLALTKEPFSPIPLVFNFDRKVESEQDELKEFAPLSPFKTKNSYS